MEDNIEPDNAALRGGWEKKTQKHNMTVTWFIIAKNLKKLRSMRR